MHDKPGDTYLIRDLETVRVVADPLRSQILELLIQDSQTVKQVADKLGMTPNKLYYHFSLLEKANLIEVAETHMVANMLEKIYRAAARYIDVEPSLISFATEEGKATIHSLITPVIDTTREDLIRSLQARQSQLEQGAPQHPRVLFVGREVSHIPEERIDEFKQRIHDLMEEFVDAGDGKPSSDSPSYALAVAFYPSFYYYSIGDETADTE